MSSLLTRILVATDGSEDGALAVCAAADLLTPAPAALDLHLDRHAGAFDFGGVEHPVHPVDHRPF